MAHAHADVYAATPVVSRNDSGEIAIRAGSISMLLNDDESIRLATALLNLATTQQVSA